MSFKFLQDHFLPFEGHDIKYNQYRKSHMLSIESLIAEVMIFGSKTFLVQLLIFVGM